MNSQSGTANVLIVGGVNRHDVGYHLMHSASGSGSAPSLLDSKLAFGRSRVLQSFFWRLGRRPARLNAFQRILIDRVNKDRPDVVLTTGIAPVVAGTIERIKSIGTQVINYSTDDPWNRSHHAHWFLRSLPCYDAVFTPRIHTRKDFEYIGCTNVYRCMFGYSPTVHAVTNPVQQTVRDCDVAIVGGADAARAQLAQSLINAGLNIGLWGGYWNRYGNLRKYSRGILSIDEVTSVIQEVPVNICLVRRSNRDYHSMRTFEIPAARGCMVIERTPDHTELFESDEYDNYSFSSDEELIDTIHKLLESESKREQFRKMLNERVIRGHHTYHDRLSYMLQEL